VSRVASNRKFWPPTTFCVSRNLTLSLRLSATPAARALSPPQTRPRLSSLGVPHSTPKTPNPNQNRDQPIRGAACPHPFFSSGRTSYWNSAKPPFAVRGSRGRAPCQHPSDSGEAFRKRVCAACCGGTDGAAEFKNLPARGEAPPRPALRRSTRRDVPRFETVLRILLAESRSRFISSPWLLMRLPQIGRLPGSLSLIAWPVAWHGGGSAGRVLRGRKRQARLRRRQGAEGLMFLQSAQEADPKITTWDSTSPCSTAPRCRRSGHPVEQLWAVTRKRNETRAHC